ncbi:hypothetical protein KP806_07460 [Paenibacillus sp. N4]|uniref:hypothetical protein n=1 Tax=Paenibacillus vietnamensis TaxID=2590547 RepID=UPI001CD07FB9|nr:hypothetical protein [Paenibacillus vietnamensis]MCA0754883.1 hypothetical protein [Paenibacillus vietnamensis]
MKFSKMSYIIVPVSIILFGLFVYPTLYKYDKLEQQYPVKINRITGEVQILRGDGWITTADSNIYEDKMLAYKNEIEDLINRQNDEIAAQVTEAVKEEVLDEVTEQLASVEQEITAYKEHKTDAENYFTQGDSMDKVKSAMGTPDSISNVGPYDTWYYGRSSVKFHNDVVSGWDNNDGNLMIK